MYLASEGWGNLSHTGNICDCVQGQTMVSFCYSRFSRLLSKSIIHGNLEAAERERDPRGHHKTGLGFH